ncbi:MAG: hypothetical protein HKN98_01285 [Silicimonas sp.]|nr:hypothetical protein [Silicimonas sp.]NND20974.1 hypothetical protein [Silicimonas sp.]NNF91628.1 hypothetical protein [Boseongicola sp.]
MALENAQRSGFEDRLTRIKKGGANTMGEVQIGPRDESQRGKSRPSNTVRIKRKKRKNVKVGEGSNVVFGLVAVFVGGLSMVVGQATEFHLFQPDGLFTLTLPTDALAPVLPYVQFIIGGILALALGWAFGLTNTIRRIALILGLVAATVWHAQLVERYPGVYTAIFSEAYVAEKLG